MRSQRTTILGLLLLAGCGEPALLNETGEGSTTPPYVRAESSPTLLSDMVQPVRVGELGPNFAACNARGAIRDRTTDGTIEVRAAPFEQAGEIARLGEGSEFFICSRTNDQRWFGIVYDEDGRATDRCGLSAPIPARRNYQGPCAAGWVASASVRLISGIPDAVPSDASPPD
jgi:hypothetical protein